MKTPYQHEWNKEKARGLPDPLEREPIDFYTEEESDHIDEEKERDLVAELEKVRESRRQLLTDKEAVKRSDKAALIKRQEKWLAAWHLGLLFGSIIALVKIVDTVIKSGT